MSWPILEAKGLEAWYGPARALHGIDFEVEDGGVTAVLGANGAGKTTILRALSGLIRARGRHPVSRPRDRRAGDGGHRAPWSSARA